jgi:hypothetical protein
LLWRLILQMIALYGAATEPALRLSRPMRVTIADTCAADTARIDSAGALALL